jgi:iron-sulfur cluster assembly protein
MVNVSDAAVKQLKYLLSEDNKQPEESYVRVGVKPGGCSGLSYVLDFEYEVGEKDKVIQTKGINLLISKKSVFYLIGTTLEYSSGLNGKGFHWTNPKAQRSCGCGESFSL